MKYDSTEAFVSEGFSIVPEVLDPRQCDSVARDIEGVTRDHPGSRNLLELPTCREVVRYLRANACIVPFLSAAPVAVQCTLFEKSPSQNWTVALHQDIAIPVAERISCSGCTGWSRKENVHYVQPPVPVLESLVAVRVHLDDSGPENGSLRVVPGSHRAGRLSLEAANEARREHGERQCLVPRGAALFMRPLLLHASSKVVGDSRRRVLHFLFGPSELPLGLRWHWAV